MGKVVAEMVSLTTSGVITKNHPLAINGHFLSRYLLGLIPGLRDGEGGGRGEGGVALLATDSIDWWSLARKRCLKNNFDNKSFSNIY